MNSGPSVTLPPTKPLLPDAVRSVCLRTGNPQSHRCSSLRCARAAFTLIEVSVVVLLLTLLASITVLRLKGPYDLAKQRSDQERIAFIDSLARSYARRHQTSTNLQFDIDEQTISLIVGPVEDEKQLHQLALRGNLQLESILTRDQDSTLTRYTIAVGRHGHSQTYALNLSHSGSESNWTVVLGLSGQRVSLDDRYEVQNLLRSLSANRTNID